MAVVTPTTPVKPPIQLGHGGVISNTGQGTQDDNAVQYLFTVRREDYRSVFLTRTAHKSLHVSSDRGSSRTGPARAAGTGSREPENKVVTGVYDAVDGTVGLSDDGRPVALTPYSWGN